MTALTITAEWDNEASVWVATSEDILGLAAEADTLDALRAKLTDLVPELIDENGLPPGADPSSPIEIVARQRLEFRAACWSRITVPNCAARSGKLDAISSGGRKATMSSGTVR